ncbi:MAG: hypothetical protein GX643_13285 [Acidimicrobiales bacterium]|nr:hypothetical protein [Acidimicrobiales bacterium]
MLNPFGKAKRRHEALRRALVRGEAVDVDCRLRRTSARGWGPWTPGVVDLGPLPDGVATWHVDDPIAVGLPSVHGPVDARFADVDQVWLRPVRFQTEAFWGMESQIVVLEGERSTVELAVLPDLAEPLAERLGDLLAGP